jgi:1-acyl-sn-glycerol-3-phosphate acyltransferase
MFTSIQYYNSKMGILFQYLVIYLFIRPYYKIFFKMKTIGKEHIPVKQSVIFAASHSSYHDPTILSSAIENSIAYMAKKELFAVPGLSLIITLLGAFPVNRQKLEISTIKNAKFILSTNKWNLGIFPQGTRVMDGGMGEVKPGFSYLARMTGSRVLPVFIDLKLGKKSFYGDVIVKIGPPLPYSDDPEQITANWKAAILELKK